MKLEINEIALPNITRRQATEIRDAFLSANKDRGMWVHTEMKEKYPAAYELFQLLGAVFESSATGFHNYQAE